MNRPSAPFDPVALRRHKVRNSAQALLLLGGMVVMLAFCGWLLAGIGGVVAVAVLGVVALALRPAVPPATVLRLYGARPLPVAAAPQLHGLVRALARRAGLPATPQLYYVPSRMLNAFAVGRPGDAALGVTDGLLRGLGGRELTGVLAHEIAHIRSDDLAVMTLADTVGRLTHGLAYAGLALSVLGMPLWLGGAARVLVVAAVLVAVPTVVTLAQLALSRAREYDADLEAVALTGDPRGLANALATLERREGRIWERILVPHRRTPDPLLLRTHPPTEERIRRLAELVPALPAEQLVVPDLDAPPGYGRVTRPVRLRYPGVRW